ncbi:MAG TPA: hypothetical protein VGN10_06570 [Pyrinomonadaceae bacterium]
MTKKDEINKNNNSSIIIGIAAFAFAIVIAIIAINFFTPKSHAQVNGKDFDNVAVSSLNKPYSQSVKGTLKDEWTKDEWTTVSKFDEKQAFKPAQFTSVFNQFVEKKENKDWGVMFLGDKTSFTASSVKAEKFTKFSWSKGFAKEFNTKFADEFNSKLAA